MNARENDIAPDTVEQKPKITHQGKPNRLIQEKSPYLQQHAFNPVDWYPWGDEAFQTATEGDKPIFLSIGYSTCHWCHVMEHESFEDEEVAKILNEHFVSIKVDREERPDIDHVYMTVCQAMTGTGGWPLNLFLTPQKKPFYAGTYFPKTERYGNPGLIAILKQIANLWNTNKESIIASSEQATQVLQSMKTTSSGEVLTVETLKQAYGQLRNNYDGLYGGFGSAPKFPTPHNYTFLLRWWKRSSDHMPLEMVEKTLDRMGHGGLYDQLGGGFHRYSTDEYWLVPHFEKMLYDQAQLVIAYLETYQATGKAFYADIARGVLDYVLRDMTSPDGGFFSAEDADSEGVEGRFYVWTSDEIIKILGEKDGRIICNYYDVSKEGDFEDNNNILRVDKPVDAFVKLEGIGLGEFQKLLGSAREKLFQAREQRIHPHKDDKILTSWNGLMISAFARGAQALDKPQYTRAAAQAADFVLSDLRKTDGTLLRCYRLDEAFIPAYLDDYAYFVGSLIDLYETT
ncbi:MAG: thioredoxin domain-containing protein, partial [Planctomycetota bacterium]